MDLSDIKIDQTLDIATLKNLSVTPLPGEGLFKISVTPVYAKSIPLPNLPFGKEKLPCISINCATGVQLLSGASEKELPYQADHANIPLQEWIVKADDNVEKLAQVTFDAGVQQPPFCFQRKTYCSSVPVGVMAGGANQSSKNFTASAKPNGTRLRFAVSCSLNTAQSVQNGLGFRR